MYTVLNYGRMIADRVRMGAFSEALRRAVNPESVVVDIGTGTGIFALLACQFGARRVYAIEPDDVIQVAKETASANGYSDRIEFIQKMSTQTTLNEPADVIISDLGGLLPWFQNHIPSIVDARKRLLAPGGCLIPQSDTAWVAVVEDSDMYDYLVCGWNPERFGLNLQPAQRLVLNSFRKATITKDRLLVEPKCWACLDYNKVEDADITAAITWRAERSGTAHGITIWFDRLVAEGISLSNAPGASADISPAIYGMTFFPWVRPVVLIPGDIISVTLDADLVGEDYIWSWKTKVLDHGNPTQAKAEFEQSTFYAAPLSLERLRKRASDHTPLLNSQAEIDFCILQMMNGNNSQNEIAERIAERFPEQFESIQCALTRVNDMSLKYSR